MTYLSQVHIVRAQKKKTILFLGRRFLLLQQTNTQIISMKIKKISRNNDIKFINTSAGEYFYILQILHTIDSNNYAPYF